MISEMFTVFDMVAEQWLEPFYQPTSDAAIRGFKEACNLDSHQFAKFPEDYILYKIGEFNGATGIISAHDPVKIAMATSFAPKSTNVRHLDLEAEA